MDLTIEQTLQQGVAAHKEGKLEEAERLYRAILQSQPLHPHANHNLGVLAVSVDKADAALPLFKTALEANPKIEQFWLSYIDALIKEKQFDNAKEVFEQGKKEGLSGDKVDAVETQLTPKTQVKEPKSAVQKKSLTFSETRKKLSGNKEKKAKKRNLKGINPSEAEINNLLQHYQKGRYGDAEKLSLSISQRFPESQFGWKALGAVLKQTGRISEALVANQKSVQLAPKDFEAHYNLGVALKDLGRLEEAEASYRQAITLKPDYAEAHNNLGSMLKALGRLDEAEASYTQAIALKPNSTQAHYNLGVTLQELDRLEEAEASYRQVIALKPDYAEAHNNLGKTLKGLRKYEEAILHFDLVNDRNATAQSLECLYVNKNYFEFDKRIHSMSALDNLNIRVAAVSAFAAHQMKKKDPYQFCTNPLDFIVIKNLAEYDFYSNNLVDEIIRESDEYQLIWESRTTKFGFQGPNDIFENSSKTISHLEGIVQQAVDAYYDRFKSESNIFIKSWPRKHKLMGWYNRLLKNGYHTSHIHPGGWLSGVIYLKTTALSNNDEGAIEFGLHGYDLPITDEDYPRELHRPKRGDIILFPSSLFHRTIPFTTDSERCAIAFDLTPV